jgi:hypothetical protein
MLIITTFTLEVSTLTVCEKPNKGSKNRNAIVVIFFILQIYGFYFNKWILYIKIN